MAVNFNNIVVYDLETGGLNAGVHGVCEIAMIALDIHTLDEIGRYEAVIQPYKRLDGSDMVYDDRAFKVNGLSMKKIQNGKPAKQVVKEVSDFLKSAKSKTRKPMLAGHNINGFDNDHLFDFFEQQKVDLMKVVHAETIDTLIWAKWKWIADPEMTKFNLGACCKKSGIRLIDAHSAMPDTEANAKLLVKMLTSLRGTGGEITEEDKEIFRETFEY